MSVFVLVSIGMDGTLFIEGLFATLPEAKVIAEELHQKYGNNDSLEIKEWELGERTFKSSITLGQKDWEKTWDDSDWQAWIDQFEPEEQ